MKPQAFLAVILFASAPTLTAGAFAADAEKAVASDSAMPKDMPYHSHRDEKVGIPAETAKEDAMAADRAKHAEKKQPNPSYDRTRHFHPRDGK